MSYSEKIQADREKIRKQQSELQRSLDYDYPKREHLLNTRKDPTLTQEYDDNEDFTWGINLDRNRTKSRVNTDRVYDKDNELSVRSKVEGKKSSQDDKKKRRERHDKNRSEVDNHFNIRRQGFYPTSDRELYSFLTRERENQSCNRLVDPSEYPRECENLPLLDDQLVNSGDDLKSDLERRTSASKEKYNNVFKDMNQSSSTETHFYEKENLYSDEEPCVSDDSEDEEELSTDFSDWFEKKYKFSCTEDLLTQKEKYVYKYYESLKEPQIWEHVHDLDKDLANKICGNLQLF